MMKGHDAAALTVRGLSKSFGGFRALTDISLDVEPGERLGIIGPNGSGKTTLMNCISGALQPDAGTVRLGEQDITAEPLYCRARLGIARSFQIPRPFHGLSVLENLLVPLRYCADGGSTAGYAEEAALRLLEEFDLAGHARRRPGELSQVQQRKLELARALAAGPRILISDEAMAGLAHSEVDEVLDVIERVSARGVTVLMIEHIMRAITRFSQKLVCLQAGRVIAVGSVHDVMASDTVREAYLGT